MREFLFSDLMAQVCLATLGEDVYLFWEQYVVKGGEAGMKFSWHQDSAYIGFPNHKPYLTSWGALVDMSVDWCSDPIRNRRKAIGANLGR